VNLDELLDGPPRHLERYAPPWAAARRTVCGRPLNDVAGWVTYEAAKRLIERLGQTRARLVFCQTCLTQQRHMARPTAWDTDPASVVRDWAERAIWTHSPGYEETRNELLALGRLVAAHRDEYDALVAGYAHDEVALRRKAKEAGL